MWKEVASIKSSTSNVFFFFLSILFLQSLFQFPTRSEKVGQLSRQRGVAIFFPVEWKAVSLQRKGEPAISSRNFPRQSRVKPPPPPPPRPRGRLFSFCRRLGNFLARRQPEYFVIEKLDLAVEEGLSFHQMEINVPLKFLKYIQRYSSRSRPRRSLE